VGRGQGPQGRLLRDPVLRAGKHLAGTQ
jgi:hypothetical protein